MEERPLSILGLSTKTGNLLNSSRFCTVEELAKATQQELLTLRKFGRGALREVQEAFETIGEVPVCGLPRRPKPMHKGSLIAHLRAENAKLRRRLDAIRKLASVKGDPS